MPVVEEVNDDATGSGHSGSGDRAQTGSSGSSSSFSRLMVKASMLICCLKDRRSFFSKCTHTRCGVDNH